MTRLIYLLLLAGFSLSGLALADVDNTYGKELFLTAGGYGCQVCHGQVAHGGGQAGGYIRGANVDSMIKSLAEVPVMKPLATVLQPEDLEALAEYLKYLGTLPLVTIIYSNDQWNAVHESLIPGTKAQIVIHNDSFEDQTIDLRTIGLGQLTIAPLATEERTWVVLNEQFMLPEVTVSQSERND